MKKAGDISVINQTGRRRYLILRATSSSLLLDRLTDLVIYYSTILSDVPRDPRSRDRGKERKRERERERTKERPDRNREISRRRKRCASIDNWRATQQSWNGDRQTVHRSSLRHAFSKFETRRRAAKEREQKEKKWDPSALRSEIRCVFND